MPSDAGPLARSPVRRLRHRLEYAGWLAVGGVFRALPVRMASALGGQLFRRLGPFSRKRHPRMLRNLAKAFPAMTDEARRGLAIAVWENLGRVFAEFFHLDEIVRGRVTCENPDLLDALAASPQGCVICAAHQANWELPAGVLVQHGLAPMGVYHPLSNPLIDAAVMRRRRRFYTGGLLSKRQTSTPLNLMRHGRKGGAVASLVDQYTHEGLEVRFFDRAAATTRFPAIVAQSLNLPLIVIHIMRRPGARFALTFNRMPTPAGTDKDAVVAELTANVQAELERTIRLQPDQWMWTHRRWGWDET